MQYVETFMLRFDEDHNGKLEGSELNHALEEAVGAWASAIGGIGTSFLSYKRYELIELFAELKDVVE